MGKRCCGGGFVIPDVGAVAEAAAAMIVGAFEAVELAIGRAEAGLGDERGEGGHGGVAHGGRAACCRAWRRRSGGCEPPDRADLSAAYAAACPGAGETRRVVIADDGVLVAFGRGPAGPGGRAIREMPGEQEGVGGFGRRAAISCCRQSDADRLALRSLGAELAIVAEIVPEEQRAGPPLGLRPAAQIGRACLRV